MTNSMGKRLQSDLVSPFLSAVFDGVNEELNGTVRRGNPEQSFGPAEPGDWLVLIHVMGPSPGFAALSIPDDTAKEIASRLARADAEEKSVTESLLHFIARLAGHARRALEGALGGEVRLGLPAIVRGEGCVFELAAGQASVDLPFESSLGPFVLRLGFETG